jgi:glycine/D-amino acid oxidase-like deaminating enzyme
VPVGFALLVGANHTDALVRNVDTVRSCGGRTELLEPEQLVRSYPGLRLGGFAAAAYEPDCGYGDPATTARALLAAAEAAGAMLLRGVRVERLLTHGERISGVRTTVGDIPAATVVLAAGAASAALARTIGLEIPVIPQPIGMAFSFPGDRTASAPVPATIDDTIGNYLRPADRAGIYFGVPCHAEPTDLRQERVLRADDIESTRVGMPSGHPPGCRRLHAGPASVDRHSRARRALSCHWHERRRLQDRPCGRRTRRERNPRRHATERADTLPAGAVQHRPPRACRVRLPVDVTNCETPDHSGRDAG